MRRATTACSSGEAPTTIGKGNALVERAEDDVLMPTDEDTDALPRLDKGKGKATDWDAPKPVARTPGVDPSLAGIIDGLGLSPAEAQLNLKAFPRSASKNGPAPSRECGCGRLSDGPSSGHTLACQNARGISQGSLSSVPEVSSRTERYVPRKRHSAKY